MKLNLPKLDMPASEAYVPSPGYVRPGNYAHEIEDLMCDWLAEKCPGWASDIPIPDDMQERLRIARRLESQWLWLEASGRYSARDHWGALLNLKPHLPAFYVDDACARVRNTVKVWEHYSPPTPAEGDE